MLCRKSLAASSKHEVRRKKLVLDARLVLVLLLGGGYLYALVRGREHFLLRHSLPSSRIEITPAHLFHRRFQTELRNFRRGNQSKNSCCSH